MKKDLNYLLQKSALEEAVIRYCTSVDKLDDLDGLLSNFTEDAVFDLTGLHLPKLIGHAQIRAFFAQVFEDMTHHMHILSNFRVDSLESNRALVKAYITGMGRSKAGIDVLVYVYYDLEFRQSKNGWRISSFYEAPMMPLPKSVSAVHMR